MVGGFLDGGAVGDDQREATLLRISASAAGWPAAVAKEPGPLDRGPLAMPPGPPMAATPGARIGVLWFDQAQSDQSPVLIHSLDRVALELELADHSRRGVKPSRAQRGKRHRLLTHTTQLLKRQTMLESQRASPNRVINIPAAADPGPTFTGCRSTAGARAIVAVIEHSSEALPVPSLRA